LPSLDALRANRMPHRWLGSPTPLLVPDLPLPGFAGAAQPLWPQATSLLCEPESLPFPEQSLDLVVMPHGLELASDAHRSLAEVTRVLRPEGRVVISGLNPLSLWGMRQRGGHLRQWLGADARPLFLPRDGEFIGYWRLRDWLRLLGFELEIAHLGCYRPPLSSQRWLERFEWVEPVGQRWWPVLGAVYVVVAVKRVRGMRLIGLARNERSKHPVTAPAAVANRTPCTREGSSPDL
jgi:SAM-dependent methyltransferase